METEAAAKAWWKLKPKASSSPLWDWVASSCFWDIIWTVEHDKAHLLFLPLLCVFSSSWMSTTGCFRRSGTSCHRLFDKIACTFLLFFENKSVSLARPLVFSAALTSSEATWSSSLKDAEGCTEHRFLGRVHVLAGTQPVTLSLFALLNSVCMYVCTLYHNF